MKWAMQISNALVYLHSNMIVHSNNENHLSNDMLGDLRCANVLIDGNLDVKVAGGVITKLSNFIEFGVSCWFAEDGSYKKKPFYVGGKSLYEISTEEESFHYHFDVR